MMWDFIQNQILGLEDPTGKRDEEFEIIIKEIENKILQLRDKLL